MIEDFEIKTDYLIETKGLLKDRINSLGGSITSGTTFRDYLVWLDSLYEALEEKTIIGLPDSLEGKCEQEGTPTPTNPQPINITTGRQVVSVSDGTTTNDYEINLGKNLLPSVNTTRTINGITFTHNEDGSITANGTATNNAIYPINVDSTTITRNVVLENGTYIFNDGVGDYTNYFCQVTNGTNYYNSGNNGIGKTPTINVSNSNPFSFVIYVRNGKTLNNVVFKPQLEKGSQATSYSPYKTPIFLGKIGNYKDYIFKNTIENPLYDSTLEEGQWYIHKEIGKYVYNNDLTNNSITADKVEMLTPALDIVANTRPLTNIAICNMMGSSLSNYTGLDGTTSAKKIRVNMSTSYVSSYNDFKTLASNNNLTIYYVLNTPTNTLIEDEELINQLNEIEIFTVISEDFYN